MGHRTVNGKDSRDMRQAVILFFLFYTSGERASGDRGTDLPSQERNWPHPEALYRASEASLQIAPSLPVPHLLPPMPHPAVLPLWDRLAEGPGGTEVGGGQSPCEAHIKRRPGEGAEAAVSLFRAHWSLLGTNPGSPVSWAGRASHPV